MSGSGKSALCDELNNFGYMAYDLDNIRGLFEMIDKRTGKPFKNYDNYNLELVKQDLSEVY